MKSQYTQIAQICDVFMTYNNTNKNICDDILLLPVTRLTERFFQVVFDA